MYEKNETGLEGLSPWQLMHKTYSMLLVESKSLSGMFVDMDTDIKGAERILMMSAKSKIVGKIKTVVRFLETLLVEGDALSKNMGSLYDWYLTNLDIMVDPASSPSEIKDASANMITQAEGFVDIWRQVAHGG